MSLEMVLNPIHESPKKKPQQIYSIMVSHQNWSLLLMLLIITTLLPASQLHTSALNKKIKISIQQKIQSYFWQIKYQMLPFISVFYMPLCVILVCYLSINRNKLNHHLQVLKHCRELFRRSCIDFQWPLYKKRDGFLWYNLLDNILFSGFLLETF